MSADWMPREKWEALVSGDRCPLCREIQAGDVEDAYGIKVIDLSFSRLRLSKNQFVAGYCVLICRKHVREPYELSQKEYRQFFDDLMQVGKALEKAFGAIKMNFEILGNSVPHLHCHIIPRYYGDPRPGVPIDPSSKEVLLDPQEYIHRIEIIRQLL